MNESDGGGLALRGVGRDRSKRRDESSGPSSRIPRTHAAPTRLHRNMRGGDESDGFYSRNESNPIPDRPAAAPIHLVTNKKPGTPMIGGSRVFGCGRAFPPMWPVANPLDPMTMGGTIDPR